VQTGALIVLFAVLAVKRTGAGPSGGFVWHMCWALLALGWLAVLIRVSKLPLSE